MARIRIVPYEPKYREMVRDCVYATGFGGENVEPFFEDRELFADLVTLYYTDHEPESGFIPLVDGEPAGYLLGGANTRKYEEALKQTIMPLILRNIAGGKYRLGRSARAYARSFIWHKIRGEHISTPVDLYPAHLHIDLFEEFRRSGVGSLLINTYIDYLKRLRIIGVHLVTSSYHAAAMPFYNMLGFSRYSTKRVIDSYHRRMSQKQYYEICYVKSITQ
ncbi:MAG: GNAT family N-acetyltransferase [bacterium]